MNTVIYPILIPLATATISLVFWRSRITQRALALVGAILLMFSSITLLGQVSTDGIQVLQVGGWPAPYGIILAADLLGAIMTVLAALMGLAVVIYSMASVDIQRENFGYYPLLHILLMGVCGAFLTGDIFNLFVCFEIMLISSFVLLALGGEKAQLEGAIKYVTLNVFSSAIFLAAVGILYGKIGTLNYADIAQKISMVDNQGLMLAAASLFMISFGIKAGVFPLFFWLPASYHTPPIAVAAIFAGLLTKVGVYALIRAYTLLFTGSPEVILPVILVVSGLTMLTGVLGAAAQYDIRRILSFHIVSQIGYMVMGLGLMTPLGLIGSVFYLIHHIIVKTNLFLIGGLIHRMRGTYHLKNLGGLYEKKPWLAILFLIPAFSLAGFPPLSGFWAKLMLVKAGLDIGQYLIVAVALVVSMLTIYSMTKIWDQAFWKETPGEEQWTPLTKADVILLVGPVATLAVLTILIGLFPAPIYNLAERAAEQLLNPSIYIEAVLGGKQ